MHVRTAGRPVTVSRQEGPGCLIADVVRESHINTITKHCSKECLAQAEEFGSYVFQKYWVDFRKPSKDMSRPPLAAHVILRNLGALFVRVYTVVSKEKYAEDLAGARSALVKAEKFLRTDMASGRPSSAQGSAGLVLPRPSTATFTRPTGTQT